MGRAGAPNAALVVAIEGASGAGKSSVARALATRLAAHRIDEAFDRLHRRPLLEFSSRSELAELEQTLFEEEVRRWRELGAARARSLPVVLDTATLGPLTYTWGLREAFHPEWDVAPDLALSAHRAHAEGRWGIPDLTMYLDVPEAVAVERARRDPDAHSPGLVERHRQVARYERSLYVREFPRRFPGRFGVVTGEGSPERVALELEERLERVAPLQPWSSAEVVGLLDLFGGSGPSARSGRRDPNS